MTESSSSTHDTPASFKEALHLAIDTLPPQSSSFGQISAGLVLEAINRLQFKGFSQDDQLAAILWTLPRKEALCLAPNYLIADIDAISNLWKVFLIRFKLSNFFRSAFGDDNRYRHFQSPCSSPLHSLGVPRRRQ